MVIIYSNDSTTMVIYIWLYMLYMLYISHPFLRGHLDSDGLPGRGLGRRAPRGAVRGSCGAGREVDGLGTLTIEVHGSLTIKHIQKRWVLP